MTIADETSGRRRMNLAGLQKFGRSLMLPIAALPVAGLMLRLGSDDMLGADGLNWGPVAAVIGALDNDARITLVPVPGSVRKSGS